MMISVVIPCYNYGKYLGQAIDSVLSQKDVEVRCIVVDDGSSDNTAEVAKAYGDRVTYVYQENRGLSATRNRGLQEVTTPFVSFLDADDYFEPQALNYLLAKMHEAGDDCGVIGFNYHLVDEAGERLPVNDRTWQEACTLTAADFLLKNRFPCCALVRTEAIRECNGFDEALTSSEDRDMWIRIAMKYTVRYLPDKLVNIRKHTKNMSTNPERMYRNMMQVLRKNLKANKHFSCRVRHRAFAFCHYQAAWIAIGAGKPAWAIGHLAKSFFWWPWFCDLRGLECPPLFRIRALRHAMLGMIRKAEAVP